MNDGLVNQLRELSRLIKQQHAKLLTHISEVEALKQRLSVIEDQIRLKINENKDLKNESSRQSAISLELRNNADWLDNSMDLDKNQADLNNVKLELEFLENTFSNNFSACKAITRLTED